MWSGKGRPYLSAVMRVVLRRDRVTGQVAIGLVGLLCVTAVVFGVGMAGARYHISDIGAWLSASNKGLVVHANGLVGKVDGKGKLPKGMAGHHIRIEQDGGTVLIIDTDTGVVARVDPATFDIGEGHRLGSAAGLQLVTGGGQAYALDQVKGTVQQIDPTTLGVTAGSAPAQLTAPLGAAAIDGQGILWVPEGNTGHIVPFQRGRQAAPIPVGRPGDTLALTVAGGLPVVTDSTQASATVVATSGQLLRVALPATVTRQPGGLLAPAAADGQIVPVLAPDEGSLMLINVGNGSVSSASLQLPQHRFGAPQNLGPRVYIPDTTAGALLVYDSQTGRFEQPVTVPGAQGRPLEVFVRDGLLWANNPDGAHAVVVNAAGNSSDVSKYDPDVPGGTGANPAPKGIGGPPASKAGNAGGNPPPPAPPAPSPTFTPPPDKAPSPPFNVLATPNAGSMDVTFQPATGGKVTGYTLKIDPPIPGPVLKAPAGGPYSFHVVGGTCTQTGYSLRVMVEYTLNGKPGPPLPDSGTTPANARPCKAPGAPTGLTATPVNHGAMLSWSAPADNGGGAPTYTVQGPSAPGGPVSGTSVNVGGLANGQSYTYTVMAANASGGQNTSAPVTATLDPFAHSLVYNAHNNGSDITYIRQGPATTYNHIGQLNRGSTQPVTVYCQQAGSYVVDQYDATLRSGVWDQIAWNGGRAWVSDLYIGTPGSTAGSFSVPPLWDCQ